MKSDYIAVKRRKTKKIKIDNFLKGVENVLDESVIDYSKFPSIYNFDFSSGALTDGYGITVYNKLKGFSVSSIWQYIRFDKTTSKRQEILMFALTNGNIYYVRNGIITKLFDIKMSGKVSGINYRLYDEDVILVCSDSSNMLVWNGEDYPYYVSNSPHIKSMALYNNRMFVVDKDGEQLKYSDDLDPTNWNNTISEGGKIETTDQSGRNNKLIPFLNYLYIFRDYGITRLSGSNQYTLNNLFVSSGKIYPETIALCGNRIIFLAFDGLYSFDGVSTKKILPQIMNCLEPNENALATYHNGKYYLSLKLSQDEDAIGCESGQFTNNGLIVYDLQSGNYCITRGVDISYLVSLNDSLLGISGERGISVIKKSQNFEDKLLRKIVSPFNLLDTHRDKVLKEIYITTNKDLTLTVRADEREREFSVFGSDMQSRIRVNLKGYKFSFKIRAFGEDIKILPLTIIVEE